MLRKAKDSALSKTLKTVLNTQIAAYGKIMELKIDSAQKRLMCEVVLEGEDAPLKVDVKRYVLQKEHEEVVLRLYEIETSRVWLSRAAADHLEGRAFVIPGNYAGMISKLL